MNDSEFWTSLRLVTEVVESMTTAELLALSPDEAFDMERYVPEPLIEYLLPPGNVRTACSVWNWQMARQTKQQNVVAYRENPALARLARA